MSEPLFVSQEKLEAWADKGEVTFDDNVLTLLKHDASYLMAPAARVTSLLDGEDTLGLMGRVWTIADLEAKGAEYFHDSIIAGDTAYQCEAGFVGKQLVKAPAVPPPLPKRPASPVTPPAATAAPAAAPPATTPRAAAPVAPVPQAAARPATPPAAAPVVPVPQAAARPATPPPPPAAPVTPIPAAAPAEQPIELTEELPPPIPPLATAPAPVGPQAPSAAAAIATEPEAPADGGEEEASDMALLTGFLLDNL